MMFYMSVKITTVTTLGGHLHIIYTKISTSLSYIYLTYKVVKLCISSHISNIFVS